MPPTNNNPSPTVDPMLTLGVTDTSLTATPIEEVRAPEGQQVELGTRGKSGTYIYSGIITREEYNSDLMRWEGLKNYDIMRRSDATVQAALEVCKLPLLSATWHIESADDSDEALNHAEFIRQQLFTGNIVFPDLLSEITTFLDFGYSVFEKVFDYVNFGGQTLIGLKSLESRKQRSIYKWQTTSENPVLGITQYVPGGTFSIPMEKLVVFTRKKEGENYEGISMLRAAYKHWKMKDTLELIDAIRHERQGLGIIEVVPPAGVNESDVDQTIADARNARASEEAVIKHPPGWTVAFMDMKSGSSSLTDIIGSLSYHKREISKSILAQFLELGGGSSGSSGSKAVSADHSALFEASLEFVAKYISSTINRHVVKELIDLNFSNVTEYPRLEHSKIGDDNMQLIATAVGTLMNAKALTPDPALEQWLRNSMHAPDLPQEIADDYVNRTTGGTSPQPTNDNGVVDENVGDPSKNDPSGNNDESEELTRTASTAAMTQAIKAKHELLAALKDEYGHKPNRSVRIAAK